LCSTPKRRRRGCHKTIESGNSQNVFDDTKPLPCGLMNAKKQTVDESFQNGDTWFACEECEDRCWHRK
jgi:hypothetical protein